MGGRGSGSYCRSKSAILTTDFLALDLREFKKRGWIVPNSTNTITWSRNGNTIGQISYRMNEQSINLIYNTRRNGEQWQPVDEHILLIKTPCNFGGERTWFICPNCRKKVLVLYGGSYFRCRKCKSAIHPSVNESKLDRSRRALAKYQTILAPDKQLCAADGTRNLHKPKGMRYKTYFEIKQRACEKEDEMNHQFMAAMQKFI